MKLYSNINVTLTYQNFGSAWLVILRGQQQEIELAFNSLFNYGATNGELDYPEQTGTIATFWTDEENLRHYFAMRWEFAAENAHFLKGLRMGKPAVHDKVREYVNAQIAELRTNHEFFLDFSNSFAPEVYSVGTIKAERPDEDLRDMFVANGLADKSGEKNVEVEELTND